MEAIKKLYVIAGCNGAGKTTASYSILPTILECREFINADEIARGLSPFQPEKVNFEAGRIMLHRIDELMDKGVDFAFETTLSAHNYLDTIKQAQGRGYFVTLLFLWLNDVELAKSRVKMRVSAGGHNIPEEVIERRYYRGIKNYFEKYLPVCDNSILVDNSDKTPKFVMKQIKGQEAEIFDNLLLQRIKSSQNE